jgi:hypothetical protein
MRHPEHAMAFSIHEYLPWEEVDGWEEGGNAVNQPALIVNFLIKLFIFGWKKKTQQMRHFLILQR